MYYEQIQGNENKPYFKQNPDRIIRCMNCSYKGHTFKDCKTPIYSYGVLAVTMIDNEYKFIMIQRRNSIGYIDFIRGKYFDYNIKTLIEEMSIEEKLRILNTPFNTLWDNLWLNHNYRGFKNEYKMAKKRFEAHDIESLIKEGIMYSKWDTEEFSIPKGRKVFHETNIECAKREFQEETGIHSDNLHIIDSLGTVSETFRGSNDVMYKHIYYIATIDHRLCNFKTLPLFNNEEAKLLCLFNYKEALNAFRSYESSKRNVMYTAVKKLTLI